MSKVVDKEERKAKEEQIGKIAVTKEEEEELAKFMSNFPRPEEKHGVFQFLNKVLTRKNSSKVGNLEEKEELPAVRKLQSGALFFRSLGTDLVADYLFQESEIILSTSDSKKGFLIQAAITQKKDVRLGTGKKKEKSGWLKQKESSGGDDND